MKKVSAPSWIAQDQAYPSHLSLDSSILSFSRFELTQWPSLDIQEKDSMASSKDIQEIKSALIDLQSEMKWVFNMVGTSVNNTLNAANDAKYISNQLDCHASRIEDNTRDLHELMAKVDYLKEDVQKLTKMAKGNHCQETPGDHQMEEPLVGKPTLDHEAQK